MGAKVPSLNTHPNQSHNDTTSSISVLHLHPRPLLPQLGLQSTYPLQQVPSLRLRWGISLFLKGSSSGLGFLRPYRDLSVHSNSRHLWFLQRDWKKLNGEKNKGESMSGRGCRVGNALEVMFTYWFLFFVPNLLLYCLLLWNPFCDRDS